jgi:hypothetical protein
MRALLPWHVSVARISARYSAVHLQPPGVSFFFWGGGGGASRGNCLFVFLPVVPTPVYINAGTPQLPISGKQHLASGYARHRRCQA